MNAEGTVPEASAVLSIDGLTVALPEGAERPFAVQSVGFDVHPGEMLCIVGESGSGKSITGQAIFGLLPRGLNVVSGQARLEGADLLSIPSADLRDLRGARMSMIFQEPMTALNPVHTVGAQIEETLRIHTSEPASVRRSHAIDLLGRVALPDPTAMYSAYPHQLSGGQRQRVMIAMALALKPALLFADEPTTALDVTTQAGILKLIKSIQAEEKMGVVFVTHDFGVVAEIADRVIVMRHGRIVESGPAEQVMRSPQHEYTRTLIASVPRMEPPPPRDIATPPVLSLEGVRRTFTRRRGLFGRKHKVEAVKGVSLDLRRGETLGIVGESGSGKTTLSRLALRLIDPDGGHITLNGQDIAGLGRENLRQRRRDIQIVFQDPYGSLNPRRRVGDIIAAAPRNFGVPKAQAEARARELLSLVGLDPGAAHRYPSQFSGGQRQRICIARALAPEPKVLVADEAVSALDVSVQRQVLDLLRDLRERLGLSILFVTHDLRVAAQICDRVAVMLEGEIVEKGTVAEVFGSAEHPYTRSLLAAAPGRGWRDLDKAWTRIRT